MTSRIDFASLATLALAVAWFANAAPAQQAAPEHHMSKPSAGFTRLSPLVGEWEGQSPDGKAVHVSYQLVSGGTALLERLQTGTDPEMVTVYAPDGDRVAVTHFCSAGNQPQMETGPLGADAKDFSFEFIRATNLAAPTAGHMHHLTVSLVDDTHFTEEWTWEENGSAHTALFHFTRKA